MFKLEDIKAGYVLEVKRYDEVFHAMVMQTERGLGMCTLNKEHFWDMKEFDKNLVYSRTASKPQINKIYGFSPTNMYALDIKPRNRKLLWDRATYEAEKLAEEEQELLDKLEKLFDKDCDTTCPDMSCDECRARTVLKYFDIKEKKHD